MSIMCFWARLTLSHQESVMQVRGLQEGSHWGRWSWGLLPSAKVRRRGEPALARSGEPDSKPYVAMPQEVEVSGQRGTGKGVWGLSAQVTSGYVAVEEGQEIGKCDRGEDHRSWHSPADLHRPT